MNTSGVNTHCYICITFMQHCTPPFVVLITSGSVRCREGCEEIWDTLEGRKEVEEEDTLFLELYCGFKFEVVISGSQEILQICQLC